MEENKQNLEEVLILTLISKNWNRCAELTQQKHISTNEQREISFRVDIQNYFANSRGPFGTCRSSDRADVAIKEVIIKSFEEAGTDKKRGEEKFFRGG